MDWDTEEDENAERRRVKHSEVRARARDIDRQNSLLYVLSEPSGRKAMWDWLSHCGVLGASFDRDPGKMAFYEGRRDVGLWMLAQLESEHSGAYALMQSENHERELRYAAIPEPELDDDDE